MNKKITVIVSSVLILLLILCSCGTETPDKSITEPSSESEVNLPPDVGDKGYADYALNFASDKIKEYDFSQYDAIEVENPYYAKYEVTQDIDGNTRSVGYDEEGTAVFESTELYADGEQLLYLSMTKGIVDCLILNHKDGTVVFSYNNGEFAEYTLTLKLEGYNTEVRHYDNSGLINTEVFDISGNKISG